MSDVVLTLKVQDKVTAETVRVMDRFGKTMKKAGAESTSFFANFDARAIGGVLKSVNKLAGAFTQIGATLNELAPNAQKFSATFSEEQLDRLTAGAEAFNKMGAAWDQFVGYVLSTYPQIREFFDDITRRLKQVSEAPLALSDAAKAQLDLVKALAERDQYVSGIGSAEQFSNPNAYHATMVNGIKARIAAAEAAVALAQVSYEAKKTETQIWKTIDESLKATMEADKSADLVKGVSIIYGQLFDQMESFLDDAILADLADGWMILGRAEAWAADQAAKEKDRIESVAESMRGLRSVFREMAAFEREYWADQVDALEQWYDEQIAAENAFLLESTAGLRQKLLEDRARWDEYYADLAKLEEERAREIEAIAGIMANQFDAAFMSIIDGTANVAEAFTRMVGSILLDVGRMMANEAMTKFFKGLVGSLIGGGGSPLADDSGSFGSSELFNLYGTSYDIGARAGGGSVTGGRPIMVGERGPEMFVPSTSGNITTNNRMNQGGFGNVSIVVNGAQDPQATAREVRRSLMGLMQNDPAVRQRMRVVSSRGGVA